MNGETHRRIAPLFTAGATYLTIVSKDYGMMTTLSTMALATAISVISANWADADLPARSKPVPAIWAGTTLGTAMGVKRAKVVDKNNPNKTKVVYIYNNKRYNITRGLDMKIMATLFRVTGVRDHRVWQSHSPILWVPIVLLLYSLQLELLGDDTMLLAILTGVPLGLGYGYLSHLFGDALTYKGLPLLPEIKILSKVPILGKLFSKSNNLQVAKLGFCKASNQTWNNIVVILCAIILGYILAPGLMNTLMLTVFAMVKGLFLAVANLLSMLTSNYM